MTRLLGEKFAEGLGLDFYIDRCLYLVAGREKGLEGADDAKRSYSPGQGELPTAQLKAEVGFRVAVGRE